MRGWLDDAREDLRLQRALTGEVAEWEAAGRDADYLLTGSRLELHAGRTADGVIELTTPEQNFIAASIGRRDDERGAEEERRNQELRIEQRAVRRLRWLVAVVSLAALVGAALTVFATNQSREAAASQREARARELASASLANLDTDPELAILLALQSLDSGADDELLLRDAQEALHLAIPAHRLLGTDIGRYDVAFHPESGLVIGGNPPRLVNPVTGEVRLQLPDQKPGWTVQSVAISHDGSLMATGTDKLGEVKLWNAVSGREVAELTGPTDSVGPMAFSPDDRWLAALAPWGGGVFVWDVESGNQLVVADDPIAWEFCCPGLALDFSPDGQQLAVTTGSSAAALQGEVKLLDLTTGDWAGAFQGHEGPVTGAEFSPGGGTLITSSMDGTIRIWDVATRAQIVSTDAGTLQVTSLDLSNDGRTLVTGGDGGEVSVWSIVNDAIKPRLSLPGHSSLVLQVALDGSGSVGSSIDMDGSVRVWDVSAAGAGEVGAWPAHRAVGFDQSGELVATTGPEGRDVIIRPTSNWKPQLVIENVAPYIGDPNEEWGVVTGVSMSPDGSRLLTTTGSRLEAVNGSVALWDAATGEPIRTLFEHPYMKAPSVWSGDGQRIAAATCDNFGIPARVWDAASGELVFAAPPAPCGQTVDLNQTGELLAVQTLLTPDPNVQVWDVESGELVMEVNHAPLWIGAVAFSPDGTRLITGGGDGTVRIWDVSAGSLVRTLTGHAGPVESAVWSSDGSAVVTGSHDGTAQLWDADTGETRMVFGGHAIFPSVALSSDGRYLATGTEMGVQVWALDIQELTDIARRRVGRPLSPAECIAYHFETCPTTP
ncbi:MAG: WD40 repeat domain-containing protein [Gemmatimonadetes bacterium]|nr:WD40 repeat domain-containing protein [Gemmatimonadota bacterium]